MKEKWFQLPLLGYVQCIGFYTFLIHSSTPSEMVFCTTSVYLSPCSRVYVQGISPSGRIFQIPTVWSNMITQIPKLYLLISFGYELVAIPRENASIICGASYHAWDLPSVIICDDVAKDPSDRLSLLTSVKRYISKSRYLARYYPANIPWPMTLAPTNEAISRETTRKKNISRIILGGHIWRCKDSITIN